MEVSGEKRDVERKREGKDRFIREEKVGREIQVGKERRKENGQLGASKKDQRR